MAVTPLTGPIASEQASATAYVATGQAAAAFISGGIGCLATGLMVTGAEFSAGLKTALTWSNPVGPLSGKTGIGIIAFIVSWAILHYMWKDREIDIKRAFIAAMILTALGFLLTFPPFFVLFAAE
jgi:hypothetical protein